MITGSDLQESRKAINLAKKYPGFCYATIGVHPCSAKIFDTHPGGADRLLDELTQLATEAKGRGLATAYGEIGLDYDRLFLTGKEQQLKYFEAQLEVAVKVQLPLFLHSRAASEDFERVLRAKLPQLPKRGLVHSFTGTMGEMERMVGLGLDIGINGCSMKTEENLEVVKAVPLERLQIETDGPWVCCRSFYHDQLPFLSNADRFASISACKVSPCKPKFVTFRRRLQCSTYCGVANIFD